MFGCHCTKPWHGETFTIYQPGGTFTIDLTAAASLHDYAVGQGWVNVTSTCTITGTGYHPLPIPLTR